MYFKSYTCTIFCALIACFSISSCKPPQNAAPVSANDSSVSHPSTDTLCAAFYNVENLFDTKTAGDEYPEFTPSVSNWNEKVFEKKVTSIADVIIAMNPDFIGLCEIENFRALKALQSALNKHGIPYRYSAIGDLPTRTITCTALLSKYPLKNVTCHEVRLDKGSATRSILEADIAIRGTHLKVFVNHWPSQSHPESERAIAASVLKKRLDNLPSDCEYLLLGDFNSNYDECEKTNNRNKGKTQITGLNHILQTMLKNSSEPIRYIGETDMLAAVDGHYDLWFELPEENRMSEVYNGYNQTLDHILLPSTLFDTTRISYIDNSFTPFTWNGRLLRGNIPYRWQIRNNGAVKVHSGDGYSDHLPLMARFAFKPYDDKREISSTPGPVSVPNDNYIEKPLHRQLPAVWTVCSTKAEISAASDTASRITHLQSIAQSSNASLARKSITLSGGSYDFKLRGNGKISFRIRTAATDWIYFNPPEYKAMSQARYKEVAFTEWTTIHLNAGTDKKTKTEAEIEIRAGKKYPVDIKLMDMK